jgi:hypothetical protein
VKKACSRPLDRGDSSGLLVVVWILLFKNGGRPFAADRANSLAGFVVGSQGQS